MCDGLAAAAVGGRRTVRAAPKWGDARRIACRHLPNSAHQCTAAVVGARSLFAQRFVGRGGRNAVWFERHPTSAVSVRKITPAGSKYYIIFRHFLERRPHPRDRSPDVFCLVYYSQHHVFRRDENRHESTTRRRNVRLVGHCTLRWWCDRHVCGYPCVLPETRRRR